MLILQFGLVVAVGFSAAAWCSIASSLKAHLKHLASDPRFVASLPSELSVFIDGDYGSLTGTERLEILEHLAAYPQLALPAEMIKYLFEFEADSYDVFKMCSALRDYLHALDDSPFFKAQASNSVHDYIRQFSIKLDVPKRAWLAERWISSIVEEGWCDAAVFPCLMPAPAPRFCESDQSRSDAFFKLLSCRVDMYEMALAAHPEDLSYFREAKELSLQRGCYTYIVLVPDLFIGLELKARLARYLIDRPETSKAGASFLAFWIGYNADEGSTILDRALLLIQRLQGTGSNFLAVCILKYCWVDALPFLDGKAMAKAVEFAARLYPTTVPVIFSFFKLQLSFKMSLESCIEILKRLLKHDELFLPTVFVDSLVGWNPQWVAVITSACIFDMELSPKHNSIGVYFKRKLRKEFVGAVWRPISMEMNWPNCLEVNLSAWTYDRSRLLRLLADLKVPFSTESLECLSARRLVEADADVFNVLVVLMECGCDNTAYALFKKFFGFAEKVSMSAIAQKLSESCANVQVSPELSCVLAACCYHCGIKPDESDGEPAYFLCDLSQCISVLAKRQCWQIITAIVLSPQFCVDLEERFQMITTLASTARPCPPQLGLEFWRTLLGAEDIITFRALVLKVMAAGIRKRVFLEFFLDTMSPHLMGIERRSIKLVQLIGVKCNALWHVLSLAGLIAELKSRIALMLVLLVSYFKGFYLAFLASLMQRQCRPDFVCRISDFGPDMTVEKLGSAITALLDYDRVEKARTLASRWVSAYWTGRVSQERKFQHLKALLKLRTFDAAALLLELGSEWLVPSFSRSWDILETYFEITNSLNSSFEKFMDRLLRLPSNEAAQAGILSAVGTQIGKWAREVFGNGTVLAKNLTRIFSRVADKIRQDVSGTGPLPFPVEVWPTIILLASDSASASRHCPDIFARAIRLLLDSGLLFPDEAKALKVHLRRETPFYELQDPTEVRLLKTLARWLKSAPERDHIIDAFVFELMSLEDGE